MAARREETCTNCRQIFLLSRTGDSRHAKRLPFLLKCGHTLCGVCIAAAARKAKDVISCTDCGSKTPYNPAESTEEQLVPNILILGLVAARHLNLKRTPRQSVWNRSFGGDKPKSSGLELTEFQPHSETEENKCDECSTKVAQKKCLQCDGFFCDTCYKIVHATANTLRKHKSIPAYQASLPPPTCSSHYSRVSYYCQTDCVIVCPDCIIQSHKEHNVVPLEEAASAIREECQELIGDSQSVLSAIKAKKQEVEGRLQEAHRRSQATCSSMERHMRDLHTLLQKRELDLHQQLNRSVDLQISPLLEMETALDADLGRVTDILLQARDKIKSDVSLLQNSAQLLDSLKGVKEIVLGDLPSIDHISFQLSAAVKETIIHAGAFQVEASNNAGDIRAEPSSSSISITCETATSPAPPPSGQPPASSPTAPSDKERMRSSLSPLAPSFTPKKSPKSSSRGSSISSSARSRSGSRSRTATPLPQLPRSEDTVPVWVSSTESPDEFFIQFKSDEEDLQKLARNLNDALNHSSVKIDKTELMEGMMVAAIFSLDDQWYRAEVTGCYFTSSPGYVSVIYLDYGNTENVQLNNIARLPPGMESGPFYSHRCLLAGVQPPCQYSNMAPPSWSPKAITHFKNLVDSEEDEEVKVTMRELRRSAEGCREVELFTVSPDGSLKSVAHRLVQIGLAARLGRGSAGGQLSIPPPLPLPKTATITVSSSVSPSDFYIQQSKDKKGLNNLMEALSKKKRRQKVYFTYKGLVCVAQSSTNKKFYRAVITDVSGEGEEKSITVQFVDYGTVASVKEVWELDPAHISLPALATHCQLHNLLPVQGSVTNWTPEVYKRFSDMCEGVLEMKTFGEEGESLLVERNEWRKTFGEASREPLPVELVEKQTQQSLNSILVVEGLARCKPETGNNVEDPKMYMNRRKRKTKSIRAVSSLTLNGKILTKAPPPGLSPLVSLSSFPPTHPLVKPTTNSSLVIKSLTTTPPPPSQWTNSLSAGQTLELTVVQVNSPGEFYLQSPSYLNEVQPLLANLPSSLKSKSEFAVGDMCLAPFQGERWFRGRVKRAKGSRFFEVLYVDYGNRGMVAAGELAAMPQSLQKFPPQVLKGELAGVVPLDGRTWGMEASVYFSSLVLDKHVTAKVQALSEESVVKLHINADGRDVGQELLLAKMAHPDPTLLPLPASSRSHSTSSETEGEGDRGGDKIINRLGKELAVVAEVLTNGTAQDPLSSPSPNPPPSPPSVYLISPGNDLNPVSPEGPPPPLSPTVA